MGSDTVWLSVGEHLSEERVRTFGTTTGQLRASAEWMRSVGVDTVALEATGVYWVAAFEIFEEYGLRPILINSQSIRSFNGMKKSDFIDCQWIQLLHTFGILQPSSRTGRLHMTRDPRISRRVFLTRAGSMTLALGAAQPEAQEPLGRQRR